MTKVSGVARTKRNYKTEPGVGRGGGAKSDETELTATLRQST